MDTAAAGHDAAWKAKWTPPVITDGVPTRWQWMVRGLPGLTLGRYTDIGAFTYINATAGVTLEEDVQIGSHCALYSLSTIDGRRGPIVLRRGACLGSHSTVLPGVTIGEGTIVGAHSLVTSDLPPAVVAFGTPATVRRPLQGAQR